VPRELDKVSLPPYVIEPPDILMINAVKIVPKSPHMIEPFDGLLIRVLGALPDYPIADAFAVDPEGTVDLGPSYGRVKVAGLSIDEAQSAIQKHLSQVLEDPQVAVSLAFSSGAQQIVGEHLVGPDGRVNLGTYGSVYVAGSTIEEARADIEAQLKDYLEDPQVVVDIFSYNSKKYYVITQGAGFGDSVAEAPITGNETVLDAIARIGGLSRVSSKRIWIARPAPNGVGCEQVLPVHWDDISRGAATATNYQLMPGDRLFIAEDPYIRFDNVIGKLTAPFERLFGFVSLGTAMANRIQRFGLGSL
jgi:protein involved in polysaccharide export with SLBB domain